MLGGAIAAGLGLSASLAPQALRAQQDLSFQALDLASQRLFLLIFINGRDTGAVTEFDLDLPSDRLSAQAEALRQAGIAVPRALGKTVFLDQIDGLGYSYDPVAQALHLTASAWRLMPVELSAAPERDAVQGQGGFGVVLNYRLTANLGDDVFGQGFKPSSVFAALEMHASTPFGVLTNTGYVSAHMAVDGLPRFKRYETAFTMLNPGRMISVTLGDITTNGLAWTQAVRMGGVQLRRDFSLREDVVTHPLLSYAGMASLPSTLDVYVDNVRAYSGAIDPGPFTLTHVPMITSSGEAVFVLRDAGGTEQIARVPFFVTQSLLAKGVLDYSLDHGLLRQGLQAGTHSYGDSMATSFSLRYGLTDKLTLEAHSEAMAGGRMLGLGLGAALFRRAEVSLAGGKSQSGAQSGSFLAASLRTELWGIGLGLRMRRNFAAYQDLSTAFQPKTGQNITTASDALFLTFPALAKGDRLGLSLIHSKRQDSSNMILSTSYAVNRRDQKAAVRVNAYRDLAGDGGTGVSVGVSLPLGPATFASAEPRHDSQQGLGLSTSLSRSAGRQTGSFGYTLDLSDTTVALRGSYQSGFGRAEGSVQYGQTRSTARASFDGALVMAGGGLFASNRIRDAFAVVRLGVAKIPVQLNNRPSATTGWRGRALLSDLQSYRINKISVDPLALPLNVTLGATAQDVVPIRRGGVSVDFRGSSDNAALVVLRDAQGHFVDSTAMVQLGQGGDGFMVGYDGEVWIEGLGQHNHITVTTDTKSCEADFAYQKIAGEQAYIPNVVCK